ncbi:30S ribosomal protein S13 [candidate division WWE3 bacterium CG06_land_8_20_14_3_00_42_16]|uniref:Small ribosomal subunit protein uS13 n=4 Tax=Katanobacteria TaxID=422282 RepID=A0A2M7AMQ2_UNCKA|nr:MAG: 30S ribosomal protein S13 [bacterium CG1_02_42_9]PIU68662.1 MAG: 30S ribosomal protein S13 [candidate division WWE3 bacterium CG06_land_8_20_14_3_00_42_16]PIZ43026.1 MAG: 30S ribosomal protein S13 [candidate division WWE3 bacterium CG_4_10_14_0_2_um_filter_42_8]PJA38367.1 MAG: 30S ribosomal protein S13 [candidate division WWE3 bacterium CG_4_9_14_3_um_filter_43_9]PJC69030.1 MAG: 30S ribosomal protein S13 [candidate division WWE3 bacterium CG_4_8_14_3_um_filter_42_11]
MARIAGIDLPDKKRIEIALTYIYGIGETRSQSILKASGIDPNLRVFELKDGEVAKIQQFISKNYRIEGELKREVSDNIRRLREIKTYRGSRHEKNLPARGQRTRHNARTKKGRKMTVGGLRRKLEKT